MLEERMKGFVPTPDHCVERMVERLFERRRPTEGSVVVDAGCGEGAFVRGILQWCERAGHPVPDILAIDSDPAKLTLARRTIRHRRVRWLDEDFLLGSVPAADYVVSNPPYVSILGLDEREKTRYRRRYGSAKGRFELYFLFFERALEVLRPGGRLVFVTPEKFTYVDSAKPLRQLLSGWELRRLELADEDLFPGLTTYPVITTLDKERPTGNTLVSLRGGGQHSFRPSHDGSSWASAMRQGSMAGSVTTLEDICHRVSCGIATGADDVFTREAADLSTGLMRFSVPSVSGREIRYEDDVRADRFRTLVPYDRRGHLLPLAKLGALRRLLETKQVRARLESRTCAARKPWYAFHETPVLEEIQRPKILAKDISARPHFVLDAEGTLLPRHSVYYIIPKDPKLLLPLFEHLRSEEATRWLGQNCQRAANGFIRLQSNVLKRLPVPATLAGRTAHTQTLETVLSPPVTP